MTNSNSCNFQNSNNSKNIEFSKYLSREMQRNAAVITVVCIMLCFTFNCTFPLRREILVADGPVFRNATPECVVAAHHDSMAERSKKMASNIESALKRIRDSTQDFGKNIYNQVNSGLKNNAVLKSPPSEEDIRQYEQLVIMKKYPYLDLKEYELKLIPSNKNTRQSKLQPDTENVLGSDPGICDEGPNVENVEITNRGLSGFAIPQQLSRHAVEEKMKLFIMNVNANGKLDGNVKLQQKTTEHGALGQLKNDVMEYVEHKNKNL